MNCSALCGVPKKQSDGLRPDETQTLFWQYGCPPKEAQSESDWHWAVFLSRSTEHAALVVRSKAVTVPVHLRVDCLRMVFSIMVIT
jgi:hypothetical protein